MQMAKQRLLDSVWTMEYTKLPNGELFIHSYSRDNEAGYRNEHDLPTARFVEGEGRVAEKVLMWPAALPSYWFNEFAPVEYIVANPQNIFSYSK